MQGKASPAAAAENEPSLLFLFPRMESVSLSLESIILIKHGISRKGRRKEPPGRDLNFESSSF